MPCRESENLEPKTNRKKIEMRIITKTITTLGLFLALSLPFVAPSSAKAQSADDCTAMIADLRTATEALVISGPPGGAASKRKELLKRLDNADARLEAGGANNTYKAALEAYHYLRKAHELGRKHLISQNDADDLVGAATDTFNCIIADYLASSRNAPPSAAHQAVILGPVVPLLERSGSPPRGQRFLAAVCSGESETVKAAGKEERVGVDERQCAVPLVMAVPMSTQLLAFKSLLASTL